MNTNILMILGGTLGAFLGMFLWRLQKTTPSPIRHLKNKIFDYE